MSLVEHGRLTAHERGDLEALGFVVRERAFAEADLASIRADCEALVRRVCAGEAGAPRVPAGSYVFQVVRDLCTVVKWEPERPDVVMGVEPFAHFDPALRAWGEDPRLVEPARDLLGVPDVALFTEKLNLKRARVGGPIVLHQDYPYWVESAENAAEIATAMLFLDDAERSNGCLEVVPGSHRQGVQAGRPVGGFARFEMDPERFDQTKLEALEVPAGSVVFFGPFLVHRSTPNRSANDRRSLLYSYQPGGRRPSHESLARLLAPRERRGA
jgi:ectoine hydroxylase